MQQPQSYSSFAPEYNPSQYVQQGMDVSCNLPKKDCVVKVPCPPKTPCKSPCKKPCADPCDSLGMGWGWVGTLIMWFIIFTVLFWLIFYSLKPSFVLTNGVVDTGKVLLSAVIAALILVVIVWLIKAAISRKY